MVRIFSFLVPACLALVALVALGATPCRAATLLVSGQANIFAAGHAVPSDPGGGGAGQLPPAYAFPAAPGQVLTFSGVSGIVSCCSSLAYVANGPDGGTNGSGTTDIRSWNGVAGIVNDQHTMFLVGVFLAPAEPADPAPPRSDFSAAALGEHFSTLSPQLGQVFFIGDGLTGTGGGATQSFLVPAGAARLFLGFADGYQFGDPVSDPGYYADNLGELSAIFDIRPAVPTAARPASWGSLKTIYR